MAVIGLWKSLNQMTHTIFIKCSEPGTPRDQVFLEQLQEYLPKVRNLGPCDPSTPFRFRSLIPDIGMLVS